MIPVILSGGSGTRLWPYSRSMRPKQFLPLTSENTMLQETILRLGESVEPMVVCNEDHRFMVAEQLREKEITAHSILLEPAGRNTAPAIALAALKALDNDQDDTLLVLPADHTIANSAAFAQALEVAEQQASEGRLVTFGIVPAYAETGYGYIRGNGEEIAQTVNEFLEKPDADTCLLYTSPSPRDRTRSRMPSSA